MPSALESIAPDAVFITFPVTDGDNSRRPDNMKKPPLSAREVNWHRTMTMEEKFSCRWRNLIGQGIAKLMNKPDNEKHCLRSFPKGYLMFEHNKGPISKIRHDIYLYGCRTVLRFRSPAEFIPHGLWLLTDPTLNQANCGCKYCGGSGKSQTQISEALGLPTNRGPTAVTGKFGSSMRIRTGAHRGPKPTRSAKPQGIDALPTDTPWVPPALRQERKADPVWRTLSLKLKLSASTTRISDLRSGRRFRIGELVWCRWEDELYIGSPKEGVDGPPLFWPAIVLDCHLEPMVDPSSLSRHSYSVLHKRHYSLLRLGSSPEELRAKFECIVHEDSVLPWQVHETGLSSWPSVHAVNSQSNAPANSSMLALGTAQRLAGVWAVCNRLQIRVPSSSLSQNSVKTDESAVRSQLPQRLFTPHHDTTNDRSASSVVDLHSADSPLQRSPARLKPLSPIKPTLTADEDPVEKIPMSASTNTLSVREPSGSQRVQPLRQPKGASVTESRYEGLWYGAERIWLGDVVRLCPERDAFAPSLKLSHMAGGVESWQQAICPSPGAAMRCVLMKVDRIFARVGNTGAKECAVAGSLYELAPKEWMGEDPTVASSSPPSGESSSASDPDPGYYPWDMPQVPPSRVSRDNGNHPMRQSYPLPPAPPGYTLRSLLPPHTEIAFPVSFIAGRYYPDILQWSLSAPVLPQVPQDISSLSLAAATETLGVPLLSLCGLAPGRFNHALCVDICLASRTRMIEEAACLPAGSQSKESNAMDVDDRLDVSRASYIGVF